VNWFRTNEQGKFLWPGFGENIRVVDWMCKRIRGDKDVHELTAIGYLPKKGKIELNSCERCWYSDEITAEILIICVVCCL